MENSLSLFETAANVICLFTVLGFRDMNYRDNIPRPRFLTGDSNVTFHVGATATLRCGVIDLGTKTVSTSSVNDTACSKFNKSKIFYERQIYESKREKTMTTATA